MAVTDGESPASPEHAEPTRPERPAPVQKRSTLSKLGRMFSQKDTTITDKDATTPKNNRPIPESAIEETNESASTPSHASSTTAAIRPANVALQSSQTGVVSTNGMTRKGSTSRGDSNTPQRFWIDENGEHHHLYKNSRRQEKLMGMVRDFVSGKKKEHQDEQPLSLMSSWLDQVRSEKHKANGDKANGPNASATLVQKYGKCQEVVGKGAFGIVRIAHKIDPNDSKHEQLYAVKEFVRRPDENPKKYAKRLNSEFCISSSLRHPNVIRTLDLLEDAKGDFCQVMEYCAGGDMYTLVMVAHKLEVVEADCLFLQLMRGVEYMHEMGVAHRDLKPENLLLTTHGALKITDFGNGECFRMAWETEAHLTQGLCGSAPYIAPEEYTEKEFDPRAVDVWACGVIYMAMRSGRHLWHQAKAGEDEYFDHYLEGRRSEEGYGPIEALHRARCRNVVYSILDPIASRRITASQVLKSEWCKNIQICKAGEEGL